MRELVVISGKGGTGKTSITASFAVLARGAVMADCDVDAADLHLLLQPRVRECHAFFSGRLAAIRKADCIACGACLAHCRFSAVSMNGPGAGEAVFTIDPAACEGCGVCARFCPVKAIDLSERRCGEWRVSETRCGTMVHAQLAAGAGNSGKLVSLVRDQARRIAGERGAPLVLADGPPGIGCPVIASLAGASLALIVTEPSVSGEHDLLRVLALARHFALPAAVCVNKWDVNPEMTERIERAASAAGARIGGRIRYDRAFTAAQLDARTVVEADAPAAEDIRRVWHALDAMEIRSELARRH